MGILDNVMTGLGKGIADAGTLYMKAGLDEESDARRLEGQSRLQAEQARLLGEREKALAKFKVEMAEDLRKQQMSRLRGGVENMVNSQFAGDEAIYRNSADVPEEYRAGALEAINASKQAAVEKGMQDPGILQKAALASGDFDAAKELGPMAKNNFHNVPFGATVLGNDGSVVYDGGAAKEVLERDKMAARATASGSKKTVGETVDKVYDDVRKVVKAELSDHRHPFAAPDDEKAADPKYEKAVIEVGARIAAKEQAGANSAAQKATKMVDQYDKQIQTYASKIASLLYDKDGTLRDDAASDFKSMGIDTSTKESFTKGLRDSLLTRNDVLRYLADPKVGDEKFQSLLARYEPQKKPEKIRDEKLDPRRTSYGIIKDAQGNPIKY